MVKEKGSQLATNLNSMLNIMDQCKTDWRRTAGGLEQKLEEIEDVQKNSVQESVENITQKMLTFEEDLHANLETVETTLKSELFPNIARMSNGYEEIKTAVDDWARITRQTSDEFTKHNETLTANVESTIGSFCNSLSNHLNKLKDDKLSVLSDIKRFSAVTENDLNVIENLLGFIDVWKTNKFPSIFNSQLNVRTNIEESFCTTVKGKHEEVSVMLENGTEHLKDFEAKCEELTAMMSRVNAQSKKDVEEVVEYTRQSFKDDLGYRFKSVLDDVRHLSQDIDTQLSEADKLLYACEHLRETDPNKINVHLIHHSHDDVGWLKTVDQYYYGLRKDIANIAVENILNSVVRALWDHPDRKFIQVETAFFYKWWIHQNEDMQNKFKTLVENGQIEIINGGWSMNDEGCVNYLSVIDQFTWGFRILNESLGECGNPTFGWQIDPFGHSREHSSILWRMGFDGLIFSRLDQNERDLRKDRGSLDFLWQTSANNEDSVIYGGITPDAIYYPPSGFCFDIECGDDNIVDDPDEETYNAPAKAEDFSNRMKDYSKWFKTNHIFVTMGGDFQYQAAEVNFENSDKLIKAFENNEEVKLLYSTPTCYLKALYEAQPTLEIKTDDFFPYGSGDHGYWAGYFTSRQNYKRLERITLNTLQIAKQLNSISLAKGKTVNLESIKSIREAIGVAQHHDSITGTAKQHVSDDYTKILSKAIKIAESNFTTLVGNLLDIDIAASTELTSCLLANMSICSTTQSADEFLVVVYNPLSWKVNQAIRLPVEADSYTIQGSEGEVVSDVLTPISNFTYVELENERPALKELVFVASDIPPLGVKAFSVKKNGDNEEIQQNVADTLKFGNEVVGFEIDETTNLLKSVTMNGLTVAVTQQFMHYTSSNGTDDSDISGAYIFRPEGVAIPFDNPIIVSKVQGEVVDEVQQKINDWITQIIRVYKDGFNYIEFDWLVGPIDVSDGSGMEIVSRFTVDDFKNNQTFYTDSNGREMMQRKLNYRPTYTYDSSLEPVASNYYPVTSKISIKDQEQNLQVSILNERSQAGTSLDEGQLELMVHRRLLKDDKKGVGEALNETEFDQGIVARGQHYLILGPLSGVTSEGHSTTTQERILAQKKLLQPWIGVAKADNVPEEVTKTLLESTYSSLKSSLPENLNILTLEPWTDSSYILRLEHILEKNEDSTLSASTTIDLAELFLNFKVSEVVETTLGANRKLDSFQSRYDWTYQSSYKTRKSSLDGTSVTLEPMDIKTFIVKLSNS